MIESLRSEILWEEKSFVLMSRREIDDQHPLATSFIGHEQDWKKPIGDKLMQELHHRDDTIEATVMIKCAVEKAFKFYQGFNNLPKFLGDVMAVEQINPTMSQWTIQGPLGIRANWTIKITENRINEMISYETVTFPGLRTYWEIHFARGSEAGETEVRELMKAPRGDWDAQRLPSLENSPRKKWFQICAG